MRDGYTVLGLRGFRYDLVLWGQGLPRRDALVPCSWMGFSVPIVDAWMAVMRQAWSISRVLCCRRQLELAPTTGPSQPTSAICPDCSPPEKMEVWYFPNEGLNVVIEALNGVNRSFAAFNVVFYPPAFKSSE